jgi:hypothetical protein
MCRRTSVIYVLVLGVAFVLSYAVSRAYGCYYLSGNQCNVIEHTCPDVVAETLCSGICEVQKTVLKTFTGSPPECENVYAFKGDDIPKFCSERWSCGWVATVDLPTRHCGPMDATRADANPTNEDILTGPCVLD